ncbi:hypothetical protein [Patulibacter sp. SYSU D01012]|uniref:hypothetical protein n=1 Tax=Patulibacter sp. SYSU D01012 TaxID=2817381 RepID=UPI001B302FCE|nr:hypothetical protein [Patulibacter sp. SYSU D01012]
MANRVTAEFDAWFKRSIYTADDDLVFAHPQLGTPLDGGKVTKTSGVWEFIRTGVGDRRVRSDRLQ